MRILAVMAVVLVAGCSSFQPTPKPQSGGVLKATIPPVAMPDAVTVPGWTNPPPVLIELTAPENSDVPSTSHWTREVSKSGGIKETLVTSLGINQHDQARDDWAAVRKLEAKLKSYSGIKLFGFALILAALAMFHPAVRAITGTTGQVATGATGLVLVFGSQALAGNETMVAIVAVVGLAVYLFARRHGQLQGMVDANKNGIDDRRE